MQNKTYSQREMEREVKKQNAFNELMNALGGRTSDLDYQTMIECLAEAQSTLLMIEDSNDPARDINCDDIRLYFNLSHDILKLLKPLSEIANEK